MELIITKGMKGYVQNRVIACVILYDYTNCGGVNNRSYIPIIVYNSFHIYIFYMF